MAPPGCGLRQARKPPTQQRNKFVIISIQSVKTETIYQTIQLMVLKSGLRGLEVAFPPHDPSDAGSNPAEVVEFLSTEKFRERSPSEATLSRLTRVVDLLHVKEPHIPKGSHWAKLVRIFPVRRS
jgi:hypothetical protein